MKIEKDRVEILSGLRFNKTLGTPLTLQIKNCDWDNWQDIMAPEGSVPSSLETLSRPRPGHADLAGGLKYNHEDLRNVLERTSARETAIRVAVGTVGRLFLEKFRIQVFSHVIRVGNTYSALDINNLPEKYRTVEESPVRCLDKGLEKAMIEEIDRAAQEGDSLGGVIELLVTGLPPGLGSYSHPDRRIDALLAGALMGIQAIKAVEIGAGLSAASIRGSELHDPIVKDTDGRVTRSSNRAGGIEGGVTNGMPLVIRIAMKPIPTLSKPLASVDWQTGQNVHGATERSDVCAVPAAAVVAEAVTAWELAFVFREKFGGDFMEEIEAAYQYYVDKVEAKLRGKQ
jgi:chorismate synthase